MRVARNERISSRVSVFPAVNLMQGRLLAIRKSALARSSLIAHRPAMVRTDKRPYRASGRSESVDGLLVLG